MKKFLLVFPLVVLGISSCRKQENRCECRKQTFEREIYEDANGIESKEWKETSQNLLYYECFTPTNGIEEIKRLYTGETLSGVKRYVAYGQKVVCQ